MDEIGKRARIKGIATITMVAVIAIFLIYVVGQDVATTREYRRVYY